MKKFLLTFSFLLTSTVYAQDITLADFKDWKMTDVASLGLKKEVLFTKMNRTLIKLDNSICSNRALVWAYDFKRYQNVDAGKIFLFFTPKSGRTGTMTWWYHVAPVVNEKGNIFVLDAGFPGNIMGPLTPNDWMKRFAKSTNCKEIQAHETDLIERMFDGYTYPATTSYGTFDCYYKVTPGGHWTPSSIAKNLLGVDRDGKPVQYTRDEIDTDELYTACVEAVTYSAGYALGAGKKRCRKYLNI